MRLASLFARLAHAVRIRRRVVRWARRDAGPVQPVVPAVPLRMRRVTADDIGRLAQVGPVDSEEILARLARGDWGYLALGDDVPLGYCWVQFTGEHVVSQAGRRTTIKPGENILYNSRTAARAQGKRVYLALMGYVLEDLFAAGHAAVWCYVNSDNAPAIRVMERSGFTFFKDWKALHVSYWVIPLGSP